MHRLGFSALLLALLVTAQAQAGWKEVGAGEYKHKGVFLVCKATLFEKTVGDRAAKRIVFTYTRGVDATTFRKSSLKILKRNHDDQVLAVHKDGLADLQASYTDVKRGDTYTFDVHPDTGTRMLHNDQLVFAHEDAELGYTYVAIWLGEKPMSKSFRDQLKGKK